MSRPADAAPRSHGPRARGPERTLPDGRHRAPRPRLVARGDRPVCGCGYWLLRLYMSNHTRLDDDKVRDEERHDAAVAVVPLKHTYTTLSRDTYRYTSLERHF